MRLTGIYGFNKGEYEAYAPLKRTERRLLVLIKDELILMVLMPLYIIAAYIILAAVC